MNLSKILQTLKLFGTKMIPTPLPAAGCLQMSVVIAQRATAWQQSEVMCDAAAPLITVVFHQSIFVEEKHSAFCPERREDAGDTVNYTDGRHNEKNTRQRSEAVAEVWRNFRV